MRGIYKITINNIIYIGKDFRIDLNKRLKAHLSLLNKNSHYNRYMQNMFNKYKSYNYKVLECGDFSREKLSELEVIYIQEFDSFNSGFNLTTGGDGGSGHIKSKKSLELLSTKMKESNNPMSKIDYSDFLKIVEMLKSGYTNSEIAEVFSLHSRYISLIRYKKRYSDWWDKVEYKEKKSLGSYKITYDNFIDIIENLDVTNSDMAIKYNMNRSSISRIRSGEIYKEFHKIYNRVQRPVSLFA
jgi:hypothetical protein